MKPALCHQYSIGAEQEIQGGLTLYAGIFYKKMKLFGTLNSLNSIKRKGDKIEREKRRYN